MEMDVKARREVVLGVARLFHLKEYIRSQRGGSGRTSKRAKIAWTDLEQKDIDFYCKKVQPVIEAVLAAGYVILLQSEVSQAYRPLREQQIVRPVIRLPGAKKSGGYVERAQQERERRG